MNKKKKVHSVQSAPTPPSPAQTQTSLPPPSRSPPPSPGPPKVRLLGGVLALLPAVVEAATAITSRLMYVSGLSLLPTHGCEWACCDWSPPTNHSFPHCRKLGRGAPLIMCEWSVDTTLNHSQRIHTHT